MSPEMALGETIDGRADIYALGCVAYYLLTGTLVFEAENVFQLMAKRLRDDPVPPSQRTSLPIPPALDRSGARLSRTETGESPRQRRGVVAIAVRDRRPAMG